MKYGKITLGQIEAAINIIGGEDALIALLQGKLTVQPKERELSIWKTIKLDPGIKIEDILSAYKESGKHMSNSLQRWIREAGYEIDSCDVAMEVDLCLETVLSLTGQTETTVKHLHECIYRLGGKLCTAQMAFQLRLQDGDIPDGALYWVAMEPILGHSHMSSLMIWNTETWPRLDPASGRDSSLISGDYLIVFVKPRLNAEKLYYKYGTFTVSQRVVDQLLADRVIWKVGKVLHVDMRFNEQCNCACSLSGGTDRISFFVRDLKKFFKVSRVVFHNTRSSPEPYSIVDISKGDERRDICSEYPTLPSLGVSWEITPCKDA